MATFYYSRRSKLSHREQWLNFLQQDSFTGDITRATRTQTEAVTEAIDKQIVSATEAIDKQIVSAQQNALAITGAIGQMSGEISSAVRNAGNQVTGAIEDLQSAFDWRMSQVVGLLEISNMLAIIPDFQKERRYYIEQGIKFCERALRNPDLFEDALENFLEAEKREKTDYAVLYRIGLIYLYQQKQLDLEKGEDYLRRAGKYASVEEDGKAIKAGAEAYFQVGIACYTQGKFAEAAELSQRAFELNPSLLEAGFNQAKFLAADGNVGRAIPVLRNVIETERTYAPKTAQDGDLVSQPEVQVLLEALRVETVTKATGIVKRCKKGIIADSQAILILREIEQLIENNNYLDALVALNELGKERQWNNFSKIADFDDYIHLVCISQDGSMLASTDTDADFTIKLWRVSDSCQLRSLWGHRGSVDSISFSPDGTMLASTSSKRDEFNEIKLWQISDGKEIDTINGHLGEVNSVCFSQDGSMLASASYDNTVKLWRVSDRSEKVTLLGHSDSVDSVCFSPDGSLLATGSRDNTIKLWQANSGKEINTLKDHYGSVRSVCFSPDSSILASASQDTTIKLWRVSDGDLILTLKGHSHIVNSVCFNRDGNIASSSNDGVFKLWNVFDGSLKFTYDACRLTPNSLCLSQVGLMFADSGELYKILEMEIDEFISFERKHMQKNLNNLVERGLIAESEQDQKSFFRRKNYSEAILFYEQAAALGSKEARVKAKELKARK
ncbi:MAG: hypothetical protein P9L92_18285 [Candidatus Electryonea clarkiae]|nr:hypothetical protein [Candidatus Electryonea clarkiae]MDP8288480.1 hypothetical protein [Candidatus Electryonea clarkiae]